MKLLSLKLLILMLTVSWSVSNAQEVKVDANFPDLCKAGEKCVVEIIINKGAIEGFARLQQTLPEGFTAELIDDAGSDFIFDKQRVSFIWLNLPASSTVTVSYRISLTASLSGTLDVGEGTFSYMRENRIQRHPIPPAKMDVNVKTAPVVAKEKPVDKEQEPQVAVAEKVSKEKVVEKEVPQPAEPETREQQELPEKATLAEKSQQEAGGVHEELQPVEEAAAIVPETVEAPPVTKETVKEKAPEPVQVNAEVPVSELTTAVYYRVQIAALKQYREPEGLKNQFRIQEQVYHESGDGWNRYTFGQWGTMAEAEAARKAFISRTGNNAFLIKYQDGKRIPVN